jgi:hypothetical protein
MSNLNNVYGNSNGCPPIMNDGRGVKTNFKNNQKINEDLMNQVNSKDSLDYRLKIQQDGINLINGNNLLDVNEFQCANVPDGYVVLNKNINLQTSGGSFRDQFGKLK